MIKTVVFMGDSHTWGEGVGAEYGFNPPVICADKRMCAFNYPNYVNLIRDWICARTASSAREIIRGELAEICGGGYCDFGVLSPGKSAQFADTFGLCRIFFAAPGSAVTAQIELDGRKVGETVLQSDCADTSGNVFPFSFFAENGKPHRVEIITDKPGAMIHRIELYSGEYAVVNSGIGSCPVGNYLNKYFDNYVAVLKPHAVVFEGNTINDWLSGETPAEYSERLSDALKMLSGITDKVICHSVFPIAGEQRCGQSTAGYDEFAEAQKSTLLRLGARFVDSRAEFERELAQTPEDSRFRFIYHDVWHPNGTGHYIYARTIMPILAKALGI